MIVSSQFFCENVIPSFIAGPATPFRDLDIRDLNLLPQQITDNFVISLLLVLSAPGLPSQL
jgi:hypothetical protein